MIILNLVHVSIVDHLNRKYIGKLYTDSLVHDEDALKYLVSTMGLDRVMLGSDYPFPLGEHHPGKLVESVLDWDQDTKVQCLHKEDMSHYSLFPQG